MTVANGYAPADPPTLAWAGALLAASLLTGFVLTRLPPRRPAVLLAWLLTVGSAAGMERLCAGEPAGVRMLALIGALLFGMKAVVGVESRRAGDAPLPPLNWLLFAAAWPGMRPDLFRTLGGGPLLDAGKTLVLGVARFSLGTALVALAAGTWHLGRPPLSDGAARVAATALLLPGLSLMLHFGLFEVLAGLWRYAGVDARPLFRAPLRARSLGDFWGRRWNLAFSEMTAIGVYRPLSGRVGRPAAMVAAFVCSGLLHEVAISLPVLWGFGLPSLYFVLHGALVTVERALERRGLPVTSWGWAGHAWVLGWLALPLPLLFHPPFLAGCVWPLIGME